MIRKYTETYTDTHRYIGRIEDWVTPYSRRLTDKCEDWFESKPTMVVKSKV